MPYPTIADLPEPIRRALPVNAHEICRGAFNSAWAAVAHKYSMQGGVWTRTPLRSA